MAAASDASFRHFREESFRQIQPTSAGGRDVHVVAWMPCQLCLHLAHLMRSVIVHHQMDVTSLREIGVDFVEKFEEFLVAVPAIAVTDIDAAGQIQCRE